MATFSRMVSAIAPVRPLRPRNFRLVQVASLAYLNGMLHQFLVSASERYRLKVYILGRSFGLVTRFLLRSIQNLGSGTADADREWEQIEAIRVPNLGRRVRGRDRRSEVDVKWRPGVPGPRRASYLYCASQKRGSGSQDESRRKPLSNACVSYHLFVLS